MIYFGEVGVFYVFNLVHLVEVFVHAGSVVDIVFSVVHEVFVGGLFEAKDFYFAEIGIL
jgi:hypothetical protein